MPSDELGNLICAVAQKDRIAFRALYQATNAQLFSVIIRLIKRTDIAEDILQDCYLKIWDKAPEYANASGSPVSWMIAIARNRAIDVLRKSGEVNFSETYDGCENYIDQALDPLSRAEQNGDLSAVFQCLGELDENHRKCFLLAYYYGFTHDEIAEQISAPVGTVKSRIQRSLARIRSCMVHDK